MTRNIGMGSKTGISEPESWDDYLDRGEKILWQGRPAPGIRVSATGIVMTGFGIFFFGFAIFWTYMASTGVSQSGQPAGALFFPLFGLPFLLVGFYLVFGHWFFDAYKRKRTRYAVTNRRMLIAENVFGKKLKSYPVNKDATVSMREGALASVFFASERRSGQHGSYSVAIGFKYIPDGREVYKLIRKLQDEIA